MRKFIRRLAVCALAAALVWTAGLISDRRQLSRELIRFHVVANSDSPEDQAVKLKVRDAVLESIQQDLQSMSDVRAAAGYLQDNLSRIQKIVDQTLEENGYPAGSAVSLLRERFAARHYDTFSLPAGIYRSLRIVIGEGAGRNWWCVTFPTLCLPSTTEEFADAAVSAGFSDSLTGATAGEDRYVIRFYLLDRLGELENIFFRD